MPSSPAPRSPRPTTSNTAAALRRPAPRQEEPERLFAAHRRSLTLGGGALALLLVYFYFPSGLFGNPGQLPTYPVRGSATFEGRPLVDATIVLHPVGGKDSDRPRPQGTVAADGSFVLRSYGVDDGAPAGDYKVSFHWFAKPSKSQDAPPPRSLLPQRLANPETSGVTVSIQPGDNQLPPFALRR